ncbi:MAG: response regulator transcription factor [Deltaproteobacteria bacterium]|nr:response regulator transcription factor [Deltaproteobacteria bacterium]
MREKGRIVIAEDHTILREGLRALLSSQESLEVVGEAGDGREAIRQVEELTPDLILMDLSMPKMNGVEAIREIKRRVPETRILALTVHKAEEFILEVLQSGADGYLPKDASSNELMMAIRSILMGKRYLSPSVSNVVIEGYLESRRTSESITPWDKLTKREREILKLIAEGHKNKDIAEYLCISVKTVEKHRANLMKKLDLHSAAALTAYAMERGLVTR